MMKKTYPVFDEKALQEEIERIWGAHGAHAAVYRMLLGRLKDAARYRKIVSQAVEGDWGQHCGWRLEVDIKGAPSLENIDDAIDAQFMLHT